MDEYIAREALLKDIEESVVFTVKSGHPSLEIRGANKIIDRIKSVPAAAVVSRVAFDQAMWERDIAMKQLEEHGIPFGGKADVVAVVRCKDCKNSKSQTRNGLYCFSPQWDLQYGVDGVRVDEDDFCSYGERRSE